MDKLGAAKHEKSGMLVTHAWIRRNEVEEEFVRIIRVGYNCPAMGCFCCFFASIIYYLFFIFIML